MPLRRSPVLTSASLAARRANALKSTGPRTARGKAWSCLNALRHGGRAHGLRQKIERTGDFEALYLYDWLHEEMLRVWDCQSDWMWRRSIGATTRAWCALTGRIKRPQTQNGIRTKLECPPHSIRYADSLVCPRQLRIVTRRGGELRFENPSRARRRHVNLGWLPTVTYLEPQPPRLRRVRSVAPGGSASGVLRRPPARC